MGLDYAVAFLLLSVVLVLVAWPNSLRGRESETNDRNYVDMLR